MSGQVTGVGVVGLGSVGRQLVRLLADAGVRVTAVDLAPEASRGVNRLGATVTVATDLVELSEVDVVVEALPEHYEQKAAVLHRIAEYVRPDTVLVTTTATLSLPALAAASGMPERLVGLRFQVPPAVGTTVEVVGTTMSADDAVEAVRSLAELLPVTVGPIGDDTRHLAVQLVYGYINDAAGLVGNGYATVEDVDLAMRLGCGFPSGPFALADQLGLDHVRQTLTNMHAQTGSVTFRPAPLLDSMVEAGRLGRKTGRGFHAYDDSGAIVRPETPAAAGKSDEPRAVDKLGIIGSGTMASGIAQVAVVAGLRAVVVARDETKAAAVKRRVESALRKAVERGRTTAEQAEAAVARLETSADLTAVADCQLVVEAIVEDAEVKNALFARLDEICPPATVLATGTSSLSVTECATATKRPADVIGLHFFNPAPAMRLVEIGRTAFTAPDVVATAHALALRLGKTPVICPDRAGFVVNRLLFPYLNNAIRLAESGAAGVAGLDAAVAAGFGFPMGPFTLLDWVGLDVSEAIQARLHDVDGQPELKPATLLGRLVELGALGRKTGLGFHRH